MEQETEMAMDNSHGQALLFLNDFEAKTVDAIAERLIPADELGAGAHYAGVVYYIDGALAGFSPDLQRAYRLGLRDLDALCKERFSSSFATLASEQQDDVLRAFLGPETPRPGEDRSRGELVSTGELPAPQPAADQPRVRRLFAVIREHTVEGFFCDPAYGGNRDAVGWRLVGFPGAQWGYTAEQMRAGFDASTIPVRSLGDLRRELADLPPNEAFSRETGK
jgi:gluconate 2-dehydrogenase gamma chain